MAAIFTPPMMVLLFNQPKMIEKINQDAMFDKIIAHQTISSSGLLKVVLLNSDIKSINKTP